MTTRQIFLLSTLGLLLGSCVSMQKYNDMKMARDHYLAEFNNLKSVEQENEQLRNDLRVAQAQYQRCQEDVASLKADIQRLQSQRAELASRVDQLLAENSQLLKTYATDKSSLEQQLARKEQELVERERQLRALEQSLGLQSSDLEKLRSDLETREKRMQELEKQLAEREAQLANMRKSLQEVLRGFSAEDLSVTERDGKIYVSLSQNLLFKTGSDKVDPQGEKALEKLAKALRENPNFEIVVEGHTDNTGSVNFNWDLSVRRATAVVKILAINGVPPERMVAAGRGMHHPIAPNDTPENRAKNRRTEIILSPNLGKLLELAK